MTDQTATIEPIRQAVTVPLPATEAFDFFTASIQEWWPYHSHSIGTDKVATVAFVGGEGGRLYERWHDGNECDWGEVLAWEPPERFVITWHPTLTPMAMTEVEVRFRPVDAETTRVELEHRGWERLGPVAETARASYQSGWPSVLAHLVRVAQLRPAGQREPARPGISAQAPPPTGR